MPDRREFLIGLEACARGKLPADVAQNLASEATDHLDESIQACLERGATLADAEHEAVMAFGSSAALVRAIDD